MEIEYREITGRYPIRMKCYGPKPEAAKGVILAVHGFAGDMESSAIRAVAEAADRKGIRVVCFDFPAHGSSPVDERFLTVENGRLDLYLMADLCRSECPEVPKYLFATSFGGYMALLCADALKDFRMVLRAPAVTMPEHILLDLLGMDAETFKKNGPVQCGFERSLFLPYAFYEELQQNRVMDRSFERRMLILHGDADTVVPHADILEFCRRNPKATLHVLKGADHRFKKNGELEEIVRTSFAFWTEADQ